MKINRSLLISALIGGTILFVMSIVSWKTAYWQGIVVKSFIDEKEVAAVLKKNSPTAGVYVMPNPKDSRAIENKLPLVLTGINPAGVRPLAMVLIGSWLVKVFMAFVATWLLLHHKPLMSYGRRLSFFVLIGLLIAAASKLSFMVKGYYTWNFALYSMMAILVQWFLAGLAMGKIAKH